MIDPQNFNFRNILYKSMTLFRFLCLFALVGTAGAYQAEWPQFRGINSSGIAIGEAPPLKFGPGVNQLWKTPVGEGHSSPCIAGENLFITTCKKDSKELTVVCINRLDGTVKWERSVTVEKFERGHPSFNPASSSPATDGERVVAYFGSYGLICYDINGNQLWDVKMPVTASFAGNATSPAIHGDKVILYRGNLVDHFILAVDKKSGKEVWRKPQLEKFQNEMSCTACPIRFKDQVIFHGARSIQSLRLSDGNPVWLTKAATTATSTPILTDNEVIIAAWNKMGEPELRPEIPAFSDLIKKHDKDNNNQLSKSEWPALWIFHRPQGQEAPLNGAKISLGLADSNRNGQFEEKEYAPLVQKIKSYRSGYKTHGIMAIKLDSNGLVSSENKRVLFTRGIPEVPSPLYHKGLIYFVKNGGLITCLDLKSGRRVYQERTNGLGTHYASPLIAGDYLFSPSGEGQISVITLGREPEIVAVNNLEDKVYATPAIVDGVLYVRTHSSLFAFGKK